MLVMDASAALDVLLRTPAAHAIEARLLMQGETLHAPHLIDVEIAQVLRRYVLSNQASAHRCAEALQDWSAFLVHRYPHEALLGRAWSLRDNMTAYDAMYIALAEALDAPLVTRDARLAGAPGHSARVELF